MQLPPQTGICAEFTNVVSLSVKTGTVSFGSSPEAKITADLAPIEIASLSVSSNLSFLTDTTTRSGALGKSSK